MFAAPRSPTLRGEMPSRRPLRGKGFVPEIWDWPFSHEQVHEKIRTNKESFNRRDGALLESCACRGRDAQEGQEERQEGPQGAGLPLVPGLRNSGREGRVRTRPTELCGPSAFPLTPPAPPRSEPENCSVGVTVNLEQYRNRCCKYVYVYVCVRVRGI